MRTTRPRAMWRRSNLFAYTARHSIAFRAIRERNAAQTQDTPPERSRQGIENPSGLFGATGPGLALSQQAGGRDIKRGVVVRRARGSGMGGQRFEEHAHVGIPIRPGERHPFDITFVESDKRKHSDVRQAYRGYQETCRDLRCPAVSSIARCRNRVLFAIIRSRHKDFQLSHACYAHRETL